MMYKALLLVCVLASAMFAGTLAVDFTPTVNGTNNNWSLGWEFNVTGVPIYVTHLGFYDDLKDGLVREHMVGIWDSSGTLLVSGNVVPGDPLQSWWRWVAVPYTLLPVGMDYRIAAATRWENYTWSPAGFTVAPGITFVRDRWTLIGGYPGSNTLLYPTSSLNYTGFWGPNFQFVPIPEPTSLFLLGFGLLAFGAAARLRKRA